MRKILDAKIPIEGRDKGKIFRITEASAIKTDKWGTRAMLAISKSGVEIPDDLLKMGLAGMMMIGVYRLGSVSWADLEPLLDEMLTCVTVQPNPNSDFFRDLYPDDIEEVSTISFLRKEIFTLHTGFSMPDPQLKSPEATAESGA